MRTRAALASQGPCFCFPAGAKQPCPGASWRPLKLGFGLIASMCVVRVLGAVARVRGCTCISVATGGLCCIRYSRYARVTGQRSPSIAFSQSECLLLLSVSPPCASRLCANVACREECCSKPRRLQSRAIAVRREESPSYYRSIIILYRTSTKYYKHPQESISRR